MWFGRVTCSMTECRTGGTAQTKEKRLSSPKTKLTKADKRPGDINKAFQCEETHDIVTAFTVMIT